jgi:hypothetical protein
MGIQHFVENLGNSEIPVQTKMKAFPDVWE